MQGKVINIHTLFNCFTKTSIITISLLTPLQIQNSQLPIILPLAKYCCDEALNKAKIVQVEKAKERFDICFTYAITHHLGIIGQAPKLLKISNGVDLIRSINVLDNYYQEVDLPYLDGLVVYKKHLHKEATHFGIVQTIGKTLNECTIKSKWGSNKNILEHKLFEVPMIYGTNVSFFILKPEYQNNKLLFLNTIQQQIERSSYIQRKIQKNELSLLELANGNNIIHKTNECFNMKKTIHSKARYLLKTCMGLNINTSNNTTKETILMLAIKRNDLIMAQIFLSMNADQTKKDSNGNTAAMIAEQKNFPDAINLLKLYNNNH